MMIWFQGWVANGPGSIVSFLCVASKATVPPFPGLQALPDSKRENIPPFTHISMNMCQHCTKRKASRMGYTLLWSSLENTLFHTPKYQFVTMKTGRTPTFGRRTKVKQMVPCLTPCLRPGTARSTLLSIVSLTGTGCAPTTVLLEMGLGSKSLSLTALFLLAVSEALQKHN